VVSLLALLSDYPTYKREPKTYPYGSKWIWDMVKLYDGICPFDGEEGKFISTWCDNEYLRWIFFSHLDVIEINDGSPYKFELIIHFWQVEGT
jgi:hypothetical protein